MNREERRKKVRYRVRNKSKQTQHPNFLNELEMDFMNAGFFKSILLKKDVRP